LTFSFPYVLVSKATQVVSNSAASWASSKSKDNFYTGVKLGLGSFNMMMSLIPPREKRMLQMVGFPGDKERGERDLLQGFKTKNTVRTYTCGMVLLLYYMVMLQL
jgi:hypothetical protein